MNKHGKASIESSMLANITSHWYGVKLVCPDGVGGMLTQGAAHKIWYTKPRWGSPLLARIRIDFFFY